MRERGNQLDPSLLRIFPPSPFFETSRRVTTKKRLGRRRRGGMTRNDEARIGSTLAARDRRNLCVSLAAQGEKGRDWNSNRIVEILYAKRDEVGDGRNCRASSRPLDLGLMNSRGWLTRHSGRTFRIRTKREGGEVDK